MKTAKYSERQKADGDHMLTMATIDGLLDKQKLEKFKLQNLLIIAESLLDVEVARYLL